MKSELLQSEHLTGQAWRMPRTKEIEWQELARSFVKSGSVGSLH